MDIGIWGMGRMGFNMVRRLVDKGDHRVIAGNRSSGKVDEAVEQGAEGAYSVEEFVGMQESPRVLWTMLPAGEVTNEGLRWLDAGVSGGVWGYDVGYCTMIGGDPDAFEHVEPAFETLAPSDGYAFLGGARTRHLH